MGRPITLTSITCPASRKCTMLPLFPAQLEVVLWPARGSKAWHLASCRSRKPGHQAVCSSERAIRSLSDSQKVNCRVYRMLWEPKQNTWRSNNWVTKASGSRPHTPLLCFPAVCSSSARQWNVMFILESEANAPADRNLFVVVSFVFLARVAPSCWYWWFIRSSSEVLGRLVTTLVRVRGSSERLIRRAPSLKWSFIAADRPEWKVTFTLNAPTHFSRNSFEMVYLHSSQYYYHNDCWSNQP